MKRRTLLRSAVVGGTGVVLAGCLGFGGGGGGNSIEISDVGIRNSDDTSHTADVTITRNGDQVHQETYELESNGSTTIGDLPEGSGTYEVTVEIGEVSNTFTPAETTQQSCISFDIEIISGPQILQSATACESGNLGNQSG
jgi:hypothetical protein